MSQQTLTFVSHTHWDREWYQTFQTYRIRLVQLVDKLLDLLSRDPDYKYYMLDGQTIVLDDYLEIRPEKRAELEAHVRSGRLQIGPWHILPDEFLVSAESTIRNLLVGAATCAKFGKRMDVGNIPDPFGHISQMPQLLRGFDIDVMAFWRGVSGVQNEFIWEAPDGTEILVIHQHEGYGNAANMPAEPEAFIGRTQQIVAALSPTATTPHLLAMNGSDHLEPQAELPRLLAEADAALPDVDVRHGTLPQFVAAVREADPELETHRGEMRDSAAAPLLPGVLSARMWIKQRNAASETLLTAWAEPFTALAETLGAPLALTDQAPLVKQAWWHLLENHPHDSICGCSIDQVHREMAIRFDWVDQIGEELTTRNLRALSDIVQTSDGPAVIVFNPTTQARTDVVTVRLPMPEGSPAVELVSDDGRVIVPTLADRRREVLWDIESEAEQMRAMMGFLVGNQLMGNDVHDITTSLDGDTLDLEIRVGNGPTPDPEGLARSFDELQGMVSQEQLQTVRVLVHRGELADATFVAPDVPGLGYRAYTIRAAEAAAAGEVVPGTDASAIENAFFRVEVAADGTLTVLDKANGVAYPGLNRFVDVGDRGDEYNFCPVEEDVTVAAPLAPPTVRLVAASSVRQTLEIAQFYRIPAGLGETRFERTSETVDLPITSRVSLAMGVPRVEIQTTVENVATDHRLRVHFPLVADVDTFRTAGHMDIITRDLDLPTDTEDWVEQPAGTHPQRMWADVSDGEVGLLVANRGLPEIEALRTAAGTELALTLLRCVGWLSRGDLSVRKGHAGPGLPTPEAQCLGTTTFDYALVPYSGDPGSDLARAAQAQAAAFNASFRAMVTGAHDGALPPAQSFISVAPDVLTVSAVKMAEEGEGLIVRMWNTGEDAVDATVRFWQTPKRVALTNLAERMLDALDVAEDGSVTLPVRGRQIVTLRVEV
jgi:mannosylglycerate hydrolase